MFSNIRFNAFALLFAGLAFAVFSGTAGAAPKVYVGNFKDNTVSVIDVGTGKVIGEPRVGYKGDVQAMEFGEKDAGGCIARVIRGEKPCPPDPGW